MASSPKPPPDSKRVAIGMSLCALASITIYFAFRSGDSGEAAPQAAHVTAAVVLGVRADILHSYSVVTTERLDIGGTPRLSVRVRVPRGLTRDALEQNVRQALLYAYESSDTTLGAVSVLAYASENTDGPYDAAAGDFAPGGQWNAASTAVPLSSWAAKITLSESYFQGAVATPDD